VRVQPVDVDCPLIFGFQSLVFGGISTNGSIHDLDLRHEMSQAGPARSASGTVPCLRSYLIQKRKVPMTACPRRNASSHICTQPRPHAYRRASKAPASARAVLSYRPVPIIIALPLFRCTLSLQTPVARLSIPIRQATASSDWQRLTQHLALRCAIGARNRIATPDFRPSCAISHSTNTPGSRELLRGASG
jgi:hypothetical protein